MRTSLCHLLTYHDYLRLLQKEMYVLIVCLLDSRASSPSEHSYRHSPFLFIASQDVVELIDWHVVHIRFLSTRLRLRLDIQITSDYLINIFGRTHDNLSPINIGERLSWSMDLGSNESLSVTISDELTAVPVKITFHSSHLDIQILSNLVKFK